MPSHFVALLPYQPLRPALHRYWFDPQVDTLILPRRDVVELQEKNKFNTRLDFKTLGESMAVVRNLVVVQPQERDYSGSRHTYRKDYGGWHTFDYDSWSWGSPGPEKFSIKVEEICLFRGLRHLTVMGGNDSLRGSSDMDHCYTLMKDYFKWLNRKTSKDSVPSTIPLIMVRMPCHPVSEKVYCGKCGLDRKLVKAKNMSGSLLFMLLMCKWMSGQPGGQ